MLGGMCFQSLAKLASPCLGVNFFGLAGDQGPRPISRLPLVIYCSALDLIISFDQTNSVRTKTYCQNGCLPRTVLSGLSYLRRPISLKLAGGQVLEYSVYVVDSTSRNHCT